eukprot:403357440
MLIDKSDQIHQSLLSDSQTKGLDLQEKTSGDDSQQLKNQEKSSNFQVTEGLKQIYNFDINSLEQIQTQIGLEEQDFKYVKVTFIQNNTKIVYLSGRRQKRSIILRDLQTDTESYSIKLPGQMQQDIVVLNDGQYIVLVGPQSFSFFKFDEIFSPSNIYDKPSKTWNAQPFKTVSVEFTNKLTYENFQVRDNIIFFQIELTVENESRDDYYYFFVFGYKWDDDTTHTTLNILNLVTSKQSLSDLVRESRNSNTPLQIVDCSDANLKGFQCNKSFDITNVFENFITIKAKSGEQRVVEFDFERQGADTYNAVLQIDNKQTKFIKDCGISYYFEETQSKYIFNEFNSSINSSGKFKYEQKCLKTIEDLSEDYKINHAEFFYESYMIYLFGKYDSKGKYNQPFTLIMVDYANMMVVNKFTLKLLPDDIKQLVLSQDAQYVQHNNGIHKIYPYYAASNLIDNYVVPQHFVSKASNQCNLPLKIIDDAILLKSSLNNNYLVMDVDDKIHVYKSYKIFNVGIKVYDQICLFNNNQEVIFTPKDEKKYILAQVDYQNKCIKNQLELQIKFDYNGINSIHTHKKFPSCIFIETSSYIRVVQYDLLQQTSDTIYQFLASGSYPNEDTIKNLIMLNDSFAWVVYNQSNEVKYKLIVQSLELSESPIHYDFESFSQYVMNQDNSMLFIVSSNVVKAYDVVNKCFIQSLTFKLKQGDQPLYLLYNENKNQLVIRVSGSPKAYILTFASKGDKWEYISQLILNNFFEYNLNTSQSQQMMAFKDNITDQTILGKSLKTDRIILNLKSIFGQSYNKSFYKLDNFLTDGLSEQRLPIQRIEVDYPNQRYDIYCDIDQQYISFVSQKFQTDDLETLISLRNLDDLEIIAQLKNMGDISKLLMHYPQIGNLLSIVAFRPRVLQYLIKHFELLSKSNIPVLMFYVKGQSPLDRVTQSNQIKSITYLLEILVRFQNYHNFNHFIDNNFISLIEKQINLSEYFESNLPIIKINHKNFPDLHFDDSNLILGLKDIDAPKDIIDKYDEIFSTHLDQSSQSQQQQPIEYYLLNLPETLTKEPKKLMQVLAETETMELFENLTIQTIINFKWNSYTKTFFQTQFNIFLIFCLSFMIEILYSLILVDRKSDPITDNRNPIVQYSLKSVSLLVLIYFLVYEIKQAVRQENYLKEIWNFFDYTLIVTYVLLTSLEASYPYEDYIIILKLAIVFLTFLKINFFLRIYDGFSFLVSMMAAVFVDLKYFIGFFLIFILQFGLVFAILFDAISIEEYQGIGIFAYIMMAFRTSSGDFNVDSYKDQSSALVIISWIIWIIAVMLLNVMFMNFIIAVISESYEKVMQKLVAESYRVKVQMIVERELHFTGEELTSEKYFPKYMILRRPVSSSEGENGEWQGFVKDIKNTIKTTSTKQRTDIQYEIQAQGEKLKIEVQNIQIESQKLNSNFVEIKTDLKQDILGIKNDLESKMLNVNKQLESQDAKIEQLTNKLDDFINSSKQQNEAIIQLLQSSKQKDL